MTIFSAVATLRPGEGVHFHVPSAGYQQVRKEKGTVADFCAFCREVRACAFYRVTSALHVQHIQVEEGDLVRHEVQCHACGLVRESHPKIFQNVGRASALDVETLIRETQPDVQARYSEPIAIAERMRRGELTREERAAVLLESLKIANGLVAKRAEQMHFDAWAGLGCFMTFVGVPMLVALVAGLLDIQSGAVLIFMIGASVVALIATTHLLQTDVPRFARKRVTPKLAPVLRPLAPEADEIRAALDECARTGLPIGRALSAKDLEAAIGRSRA